jgi:HlyD family secretion protein
MKRLLSHWWKRVVFVGVLAAMARSVVISATAEPATIPRASDREAASVELSTPGAEPELKFTRPEGDWVAGRAVLEPASPEHRLSPQVAGRIARIAVAEGGFVAEGDVLLELESSVEQAALVTAQAEVEVARAQLERAGAGARKEDRDALKRDAEVAQARAAASDAAFARLQKALAGGGATTDEVDRAQRQAEQDRLAAKAAAARKRASDSGDPVEVAVARAQLAAAEARRDQAQVTVEQRKLRAPKAGEILEIRNRLGEYIAPGGAEPVVVMGDTRVLRARIDVDERDVARVRLGAKVLLTVDALPGRSFEGKVVEIARRMGRKNVRTDEPTERIDTKILEVVAELGPSPELFVGQRATGYVAR